MPGGPPGPASQVVPDLPYEQYGQQGPECEPGAYGPLAGHLPFDLFAGGPVEVFGGEPGRVQKVFPDQRAEHKKGVIGSRAG
jgi:hypothetical protein